MSMLGKTVGMLNIKFISLQPDAACVSFRRSMMSSGYGNIQTDTEQIRSKETSTNSQMYWKERLTCPV